MLEFIAWGDMCIGEVLKLRAMDVDAQSIQFNRNLSIN